MAAMSVGHVAAPYLPQGRPYLWEEASLTWLALLVFAVACGVRWDVVSPCGILAPSPGGYVMGLRMFESDGARG